MGFALVPGEGENEVFEGFRWRTNSELNVNFFWLLFYVTENAARQNRVATPATERVWFDDIVLGPSTSAQSAFDARGLDRALMV